MRAHLGDVGIPATSAEALRNQATHWAGACAFEKDAVGREHCSCGNCGGYRLFLAALAHAYGMGYADMCAESAIAEQNR